MLTLNQLSSSTASLLKQPFNHELKERLIDSYKQMIAVRIRQSVERHGLDEQLKLNYSEDISVYTKDEVVILDFFDTVDTYTDDDILALIFKTTNRVFEPIRFQNEAPFTFVGTADRVYSFPYRTRSSFKYCASLFSTGLAISYTMDNGRIRLQSHSPDIIKTIKEIEIESIFYEPEKVITALLNDDGLDTAIPLPHDVIAGITQELLQREYGIIQPSNIEVKINEKGSPIQ